MQYTYNLIYLFYMCERQKKREKNGNEGEKERRGKSEFGGRETAGAVMGKGD